MVLRPTDDELETVAKIYGRSKHPDGSHRLLSLVVPAALIVILGALLITALKRRAS